jgi:heat shock protein HtpX
MAAPSDFRALQRQNSRRTIALVAAFIALFTVLGLGLDFAFGFFDYYDDAFHGLPILTGVAFAIATVQALVSYFQGSWIVLHAMEARPLYPIKPEEEMCRNVIREMAIAARLPEPKAFVMEETTPNAFATGRDPAHAAVCVTTGLLEHMDREQMQGVIAHEIAHIRNYDIRLMTMIAVLVGGIALLSDFAMRSARHGAHRAGRSGGRGGRKGREAAAAGLILVVVFVLAVLAPVIAQLLAMAVSRQREYMADAASVEFTRNPRALIRALEEIATFWHDPVDRATRGTAHLFIVYPLNALREDDERALDNLLSSHPPISHRIARLRAMLGQYGEQPVGPARERDTPQTA